MSNENSNEFEQDETEQRNPLRAHEKAQAQRIKELEAKLSGNEDAMRKLAFLENGVDVTSPVGKMFAQAYNGPITTEAILAAATELNLVTPKENPLAAEIAGMDRMAGASKAGATGVVQADFNTRISNAKNRQEYDAIVAQQEAENNL